MIRPVLQLLTLAALLLASGCRTPEPWSEPRPYVDLPAFMGTWYVVARVPNTLERGHMASRNVYTLQQDDQIAVHYIWRTGALEPYKQIDITATVLPNTGNREWRMRFFKLLPLRHRILEIAPDGSWALLDSPARELAWIFSRKPTIDDAQYQTLRKRLRAHGVNVDKVWRVPQSAAEVGRRGYDVPKSYDVPRSGQVQQRAQ